MLPRFLRRESTLALALAGLLFWAPLPAGSVTPAAELFFRLAAFALLGIALAAGPARWPRRALLPLAALAGVATLGALQSLSWPAAAAAVLSPEHPRLYRQAAGLVPDGGEVGLVPLSLDAAVSRSSAVSWFAGAALLAVVLLAGRRARHRRWLLAALVAAALLQLGIGLARLHLGSATGLAAVLLRPEGRLLGLFPNPNSLSFLLEMALVAVAAWCWLAWSRAATRRWLAVLPPSGLWLVLFAAVALTGSRAGLAAALIATAAQAVVLPLAGRDRRAAIAAAVAVVVLLAALVGVGSALEIRRYETVTLFEDNLRSRLLILLPSLELWRRFPLTGTGLGTFEDAFPMVSPAGLKPVVWNRAHNDPLELLVTGGLLGLGLACAAAVSLAWPLRGVLAPGRPAEERAAGLAAVGALVAAAVHELLDFALVIPANGLALLVIVGSAAALGIRWPAAPPRA